MHYFFAMLCRFLAKLHKYLLCKCILRHLPKDCELAMAFIPREIAKSIMRHGYNLSKNYTFLSSQITFIERKPFEIEKVFNDAVERKQCVILFSIPVQRARNQLKSLLKRAPSREAIDAALPVIFQYRIPREYILGWFESSTQIWHENARYNPYYKLRVSKSVAKEFIRAVKRYL